MIRLLFLLLLASSLHLAAAQPKNVSIKVQDRPALTIVEQIADACDAHLVVRHGLTERLEASVTLIGSDIPWQDLVNLLDQQYRLSVTLDGKNLTVMDSGEAWKGKLILKYYDTRPLLRGKDMFPGPDLDIPEPGGTGSMLMAPMADAAPPEIAQFVDIIQRVVSPELWTANSGASIEEYQGSLVVVHTAEVHHAIEALLRDMLRVANRQIVCRVFSFPKALDCGPVVSAEAWKKMAGDHQPIAVFSTFDGQQNNHYSGRQRSIIADGDVVQKVYDPIISILSDGLAVEIQPCSTIGGVLSTIRFTASNAESAGGSDITTVDGKTQISIDVIKQSLNKTHDTRLIPPGGAAIYDYADHHYAVVFEVLDYAKEPPVGK